MMRPVHCLSALTAADASLSTLNTDVHVFALIYSSLLLTDLLMQLLGNFCWFLLSLCSVFLYQSQLTCQMGKIT